MLFHIDPLKLWVHKVLPVVYDDSLSYYEVLAKVTKKLNEVIDLTEEQNQYIEEFSTNLTNAINNWEDGMEREWSSYKSDLNNEWGAFQRNTEQYIENWKNMAENDIEDAIAAGINQFVSYFSGLTQTAVDAAEEAMRAAENAAQDAVDAVMPTLESEFDERYAWKTAVGSPLVATTAAGMTDTTKVYVYAGSETGYVNGDWYYYDGTAWQDGGVYNSAAVVTDPTLSESGVPADAKAAGDEIADLKSAINDLSESEIVKSVAGLRLLDGYDTAALNVVKCIKDVSITTVRRGSEEGELPTFRLIICVNSQSYPKNIQLLTDEGRALTFVFGDSDTKEATVIENGNRNTVRITFDWDRFVGEYNKPYADSKIEIAGNTYGTIIKNNIGEIENAKQTVNNIVNLGERLATVEVTSRYINFDGTITEWTNHDNSIIKAYAINKGETIIVYGEDVKLYANYPILIFAANYTAGTVGKIIKYGTTTNDDYCFTYTAEESGYVVTQFRTDTGYGELSLYKPFVANELLEIEKGAKFVTPMTPSATYDTTYMDGSNKIIAGPSGWQLKKYAVSAGRVYRLAGEWVRLVYNNYPLACFSRNEYTGTPPMQCEKAIIPSGETGTAKLYDVVFRPDSDGFVYIEYVNIYPELLIYEGTNERLDSKLINTLTNTDKSFPIKMQLFGDSITDDSWRDDGTWATVFENYFPQRFWDISNDAVGGSYMIHGKVNSDTGKYHELDYNCVYDLVRNEDIFNSDSNIIVIFAGTNDFNVGNTIGELGETTNTTFMGALKGICDYLSANTQAKVFFCTPIARPTDADSSKEVNEQGEKINSRGLTLRDYADAIKEACAFYQFPVIDLFYEIGWNATNVKPYLDAVGVHPNAKGSMVIAQLIAGEIKKHYAV